MPVPSPRASSPDAQSSPGPLREEAPSTTSEDPRRSHPEPTEEKILAEAAAIYPDTNAGPPSAEEIAAEAHAIYVQRGSADGRDLDDWLEAERSLAGRRTAPKSE